jgi:hypothetical protein
MCHLIRKVTYTDWDLRKQFALELRSQIAEDEMYLIFLMKQSVML